VSKPSRVNLAPSKAVGHTPPIRSFRDERRTLDICERAVEALAYIDDLRPPPRLVAAQDGLRRAPAIYDE
jgi:hypothetical protein